MKHSKYKLKNGTTVSLMNDPNSRTVKFTIWVKAGSEYEKKEINGLSHFLEHMMFKGTKTRNYSDIAFSLDAMGASFNAFTSTDMTGYYAKVQHEKLDKVFDIISDIYLNSIFPEEEIEKERGVIIEEINMYEDEPRSKADVIFSELMYGDQPAGRQILGTKENILKFKREDFIKYKEERYTPENTFILVSGKFDEKKVKKMINDFFGKIKPKKSKSKIKVKESQNGPAIKIHFKETDQAHIILGFRTTNIYSEDKWALQIGNMILGGGMSSKLFKRMRDELGMCYYVGSVSSLDVEKGVFAAYGGMNKEKAEEAIINILEEIRKVKDGDFSEEEFEKARDCWIGRKNMSLETAHDLSELYSTSEYYGLEKMTPDQIIKKIKKLKKEDVVRVMKKYLKEKTLNLAMVGPFKNEDKFEKILKFSK